MLSSRGRRLAGIVTLVVLVSTACSDAVSNGVDPDGPGPDPPPAGRWGMMGDSSADEYRADDNRGGAYASTTLNWIELLVRYRDFDFGDWGTRPAPRRTGYEFNWARSGATSATLIELGQHTGLAGQIRAGLVDNVVMHIGANDFSQFGTGIYDDIYNATLRGSALQARLDRIYSDITLALRTVKEAGADNTFWVTIPDRGQGPVYIADFPNIAQRQLVTAAINNVIARVKTFAAANGIAVIDFGQFSSTLLQQTDANGKLRIGDELIDFLVTGDEPHHVVLGDREHGGTVIEGLIANYFIDAFNARGFAFARFSTDEILRNAGID